MKLAMRALAATALVILGSVLPSVQAQCSQDDTSTAAIEECVNAVRQNPQYWSQFASCDFSGYPAAPPLSVDGALTEAAQVHSHDMASWGFINHNGFEGRVRGAGYNGPSISENVASGYRSALDVVMGWMCSPGHARNIMNCGMESMGTGVDCGTRPGKCFYAQTFGGSGQCGVGYGGTPSPATGGAGGFFSGGLLSRLQGLVGGGGGGSATSTGTGGLFGSGLGGPISSMLSSLFG